MAPSVPTEMLLPGSASIPLRLDPAIIPVTEGKNRASNEEKEGKLPVEASYIYLEFMFEASLVKPVPGEV